MEMADTKIMAPDINQASENSPKIKYIAAAATKRINIGSKTAPFREYQIGLTDFDSILFLPYFFPEALTSAAVSPGKEKGLFLFIELIVKGIEAAREIIH